MLKKVLYVILAIAFLIGTHLIAQEEAVEPEISPSASASAGANEALATMGLSIRWEELCEETTTYSGEGLAYAGVNYYFSDDVTDTDPDDGSPGAIWLKVTVTDEIAFDINTSPTEEDTITANAGGSVGGEIPGTGVGAEAGGSVGTSHTETSGTSISGTIQLGGKNHEVSTGGRSARVEGHRNHSKNSYAGGHYVRNGMVIPASDNTSYSPLFLWF